jgi:hypothetical protein
MGVQGQNLVIKTRPPRLVLGHDLRLKAGMSVTHAAAESLIEICIIG